jgi:V/A-type H+/Na+-transporting ATPase subunit I
MAIVKMNKFSLFLLKEKKEELLQNLQEFEGVQFIDLQDKVDDEEFDFLKADSESKKASEFDTKLSKIKFCINILDSYAEKESALKVLKNGKKTLTFDQLQSEIDRINWNDTYEALKSKDDTLTVLKNENTKMESEIQNLMFWYNFDAEFKALKNMKFCKSQLGTIPTLNLDSFREEFSSKVPNSYIEVISEDKNETNILVIYHNDMDECADEIIKSFSFSKSNFNHDGMPKEIINSFKNKIKENLDQQEEIIENIKEYKTKLEELHIVYEYLSNQVIKARACKNFLKTEKTVTLEGWVPANKASSLEQVIKKVCNDFYHIEIEEVDEQDNVPIMFKNNKFVEPFESITEMYSLPNYGEADPTPIMSIFYVIFFGMMLSDAGYGLLITIGTLFALKSFKLDKAKKDFMKLFCFLGLSTIVWGLIYGTFFGNFIKIVSETFGLGIGMFEKPLLDSQADIMTILIISIIFGLIHIYTGLAMKAYNLIKHKKYMDVIYDVVTWYAAVTGLLLWLGNSMIPGVPVVVGKTIAIAGLVGLVLTQGRDAESIGGKIGGGIYGLYGITSYVGDIVSYSRLLALGLATGFISYAFNLMVGLFPPVIRFTLGVVLFIGLHLFNLGVNALGAYVHSSRLQYLEFFNKFYEGGGKKFSPFRFERKYIDVEK